MKPIQQWLLEYGESHQNQTNKIIHWLCVPAIFFSIVGLLYAIKLPFVFYSHQLNVAFVVTFIVLVYYFLLSKTLAVGMFLFTLFCLWLCHFVEQIAIIKLWQFCVIVFTLAWVGQFYGHKVEGKKPSFLKDLQFLMIGPAWLMGFIYARVGIKL